MYYIEIHTHYNPSNENRIVYIVNPLKKKNYEIKKKNYAPKHSPTCCTIKYLECAESSELLKVFICHLDKIKEMVKNNESRPRILLTTQFRLFSPFHHRWLLIAAQFYYISPNHSGYKAQAVFHYPHVIILSVIFSFTPFSFHFLLLFGE